MSTINAHCARSFVLFTDSTETYTPAIFKHTEPHTMLCRLYIFVLPTLLQVQQTAHVSVIHVGSSSYLYYHSGQIGGNTFY